MLSVRHAVERIRSHPTALAMAGALAAAIALGVPTGVVPSPWFNRKVPVRGFEIVVLVTLSVISGLVAATYARPTTADPRLRRAGVASGVLGWFAVSCPLCNPFVLALLGTSGATGIFARLQPALGALAVALATTALALRLRALRRGACTVPANNHATPTIAHPNDAESQTVSIS
ncbi:MAG: hypothetical protein ACRD2C_21005 [Acidimicrobiales bacterium]